MDDLSASDIHGDMIDRASAGIKRKSPGCMAVEETASPSADCSLEVLSR